MPNIDRSFQPRTHQRNYLSQFRIQRPNLDRSRPTKADSKHKHKHPGTKYPETPCGKHDRRTAGTSTGTIPSDPNITTIVDKNGNNHNNIKTELTENENDEQPIRRSTRMRSAKPIVRLGNQIIY